MTEPKPETSSKKLKDVSSPVTATEHVQAASKLASDAYNNKSHEHIKPSNPASEKAKISADHPTSNSLTPQERQTKGIKEYTDAKSGTHYQYDERGRIVETKSKNEYVTKISYKADTDVPLSLEIRDKQGRLITQASGHLKIEQKTGEITYSHKAIQNGLQVTTVENHYLPDGSLAVIHFDQNGHRVTKDICTQNSEGTKITKRMLYAYLDASGHPTNDPKKIDASKPVYATVADQAGHITDRFQFKSANDLNTDKAITHEKITYSQGTTENTTLERHEVFDLTSSNPNKAVLKTDVTRNSKTGETSLNTWQNNGITQHIRFTGNGKASELVRQEGANQYTFSLTDGQVKSVTENGKELSGKAAEDAKNYAELTLAIARQQHNLSSLEEKTTLFSDTAPTDARQGTKPSGTLVWKDGDKLQQSTVESGQIKDRAGTVIGKMQDTGEVSFAGPPPRTFKLADEPVGTAFHGIGSDSNRLDLVSTNKGKEGLCGKMSSPDGKESYAVVGGNLYNKEGKFVGHLNHDGKIQLADSLALIALNSFKDGWTFTGSEGDKLRAFGTSRDMSAGKIYIPNESGRPVEYEVRMGMIINKSTGEQCGVIKPPSESANGKLEGGSITTGNPPKEIPLANFTNAVFDLQIMGQTGVAGRSLQGVCRGPQELQADGTIKPGGAGGIFNIQDAYDAQNKQVDSANQTLSKMQVGYHPIDWLTGEQAANERACRQQISSAETYKGMLQNLLQTGDVTTGGINSLIRITESTKKENLGPQDDLNIQKAKLDYPEHKLEDLPQDPKLISGTVKLPYQGAPGGQMELTINHGKLMSKDGTSVIGTIDSADGHMSIINPQDGQLKTAQMKDMQGAVWHLEYSNPSGQKQSVDWISLGPSGIVSIAELKRQAAAELDYAKTISAQSKTKDSSQALLETQSNEKTFCEKLDNIVKHGAGNEDLQVLLAGPKAYVRANEYKAKDQIEGSQKPRKVELPLMSAETVTSINGNLRLGSDSFQIKNGSLFKINHENGKEVIATTPTGKLGPGYSVLFPDREPILLANENRVLMDFTIGANTQRHQILGLGAARTTNVIGRTEGGLVDVQELHRQAQEAKEHAAKGDQDYFNSRPYLTGGLGNWALGDREQILKDFERNIDRNIELLHNQTDALFRNGFDDGKFENQKVDGSIKITQMLLDTIGSSAQDVNSLAQEGKQMQKLTTDAVVMAAITVGTMGAGSAFAAAYGTAELGLAGTVTVYGAEVGTGSLIGAGSSVMLRMSNDSNWIDNAKAGALEGGAMAFGSVGGKAMGQLARMQAAALVKAEQGLALTQAEQMLVNTSSKGAQLALKVGQKTTDAFLQTTAFTAAGAYREHNWDAFTSSNLALGTIWMLTGQGVGHMAGAGAGKLGVAEQTLGRKMLNNTVMSYTNASMGAMTQAMELERNRIAQELHIRPELVTGELFKSRMNWGNVVKTMNEAGLTGAVTAPFLTMAAHPMEVATQRFLQSKAGGQSVQTGGDVIAKGQEQPPIPKVEPQPHPAKLLPPEQVAITALVSSPEGKGEQKVAAAKDFLDIPPVFDEGQENASTPHEKGEHQLERPAHSSDKTTESIFSPSRLKQLSNEIAEIQNKAPIEKGQFSEILDKIPNTDKEGRAIAMELMSQSVANLHRKALDGQLVQLQDQIKALEQRGLKKITVVALADNSEGKALGYLLRTNTNLEVEIKVLDQATMKEGISPSNPVLVLDTLSSATESQAAFLKKMPKFYASDLNGFSQAPNLWDLGIAKMTGSTEAMQERIASLVQETRNLMATDPSLSKEQAVRQVLCRDLNQAAKGYANVAVVRPEEPARAPRTARRDIGALFDAVINKPLYDQKKGAFSRIAGEDVEGFVDRTRRLPLGDEKQSVLLTPEEKIAAMLLLRHSLVHNNYEQMLSQMRDLHQEIIAHLPAGKSIRDVVILTRLEPNGSSNLVHHLYSRLNGLSPENFVSAVDFQRTPKAYKDKVVVYLDDYSYTGRQAEKLLTKALPEQVGTTPAALAQAIKEAGTPVIIAHLGGYVSPEKLQPVFDFNPQIIYSHKGVLPQFLDNPELAKLGMSSEQIGAIAGKPGYTTKDPGRIADVGVINPYRSHPTNNRTLVRDFVNRILKEASPPVLTPPKKTQNPPEAITKTLWRGRAPASLDDLQSIVNDTGADIIIDLRGGSGGREETAKILGQATWAKQLAGKQPEVINLGLPTELPMRGTSAYEQLLSSIHEFEQIVQKAEGEGKHVYFHCHYGQDRTGMMAAIHDVLTRGISTEQALQNWQAKATPEHPAFYDLFNQQQFEQIVADYRAKIASEPLNAWSGSSETIGRDISNFAHRPFVLDGKKYESVEAFYVSLLTDNPDRRAQLATLWGRRARAAGRTLNAQEVTYNGKPLTLGSREHHELLQRAIEAKFAQHPDLASAFVATRPRPIVHETGFADPKSHLPNDLFVKMLTEIRENLARSLGTI